MKEAVSFQFMEKGSCCGCEACLNICPTNAISMHPDELGFLYPAVNEEKCINCKRCVTVCPQLNKPIQNNYERQVYAGYAKDNGIVEKSSSGGLFSIIAYTFFEHYKNSAIVAVVWSEDFKMAYHKMGRVEDLPLMRKSKYIQSEKAFIFRDIKGQLEKGKYILFVGCPCEVAGLKKFLGKKYSNLLTIDLVCQGPTSPKVMSDYVDIIEKRYKSKIREINLRFNGGKRWIPQWISIDFNNGKSYRRVFYETELGIGVHYMQRESCYSCMHNGSRRSSDITLADYHGVKDDMPCFNPAGTSVMLVNTEQGKRLLDKINDSSVMLQVADYNEIAKYNPRVEKAWAPKKNACIFSETYKSKGLKLAAWKALSTKKKVKYLMPTTISNLLNGYDFKKNKEKD